MEYVAEPGRRAVTRWLYLVAFLILVMLTVGGLTRLTGSGLSMVDWRPLMGSIPPLSEADWQKVFDDYKQYPEYKLHNQDMDLSGFKFIFMMEYGHRMLGRFIGLVFFFPFAFFWSKGWLSPPMIRRCLLLFGLGGLQGVIGWYMVKSGLVDVPRVSQYRLTLHLVMAVLTFTLAVWYALDISGPLPSGERKIAAAMRKGAGWLMILVGAQIISGGFVAGLKAGYAFNTFPLMNDRLIPSGFFSIDPWYFNFFNNPATVQFIHRWFAMVVTVAVLVFVMQHFRNVATTRLKPLIIALPALLVVQVTLGISTLLLAVPVSLASAHQVVAVLLWGVLIALRHRAVTSG
ncbi:MAG: COX15/CtaA family protein [Acidobacteriota bacterium]|nr:COX15/CtaA family protein [Acidobacteriota bacterium]